MISLYLTAFISLLVSSIHSLLLIFRRVTGGLDPNLASIGQKAGYNLDRLRI